MTQGGAESLPDYAQAFLLNIPAGSLWPRLRTGSAHIDEDEYSDDEEALCVFFIQAITTGRPFSAGSRLALTIESRPALTARRPGSICCGAC